MKTLYHNFWIIKKQVVYSVHMITPTDLTEFKERLLIEKTELEAELGRHGKSVDGDWQATSPAQDNEDADYNVQANDVEQFETNIAILSELESRLIEVISALAKIETANGTYGICETGGEEIEMARLVANPAAKTCKEHME